MNEAWCEVLSAYITPGSKVRLLLTLLPSPTPPHPSPDETQQQTTMSPTTAVAANLPPRPPPSSIVEPVQRSPVLSPRIADPRQQRSGSVRPPSPPQRPSVAPQPKRPSTPPQPDRASTTPPRSPAEQKSENGSKKPEVSHVWPVFREYTAHDLLRILSSLSTWRRSSRSWSWMRIRKLTSLFGRWPRRTLVRPKKHLRR